MLLFADGFDSYTATADLLKKWATNSAPATITWNATAGRFGGGGVILGNSAGFQLTSSIFNGSVAAYTNGFAHCAFWFKVSSAPAAAFYFVLVNNTSGLWPCYIGLTPSGSPQLYAGGGFVLGTTSPNVCDGQWHWIEVQWGINTVNNGGDLKAFVDGVQIYYIANTTYAGPSPIQKIALQTGTVTVNIDDLIFWDDQVGLQAGELTAANFPIGPKKCETIRPSGAGTNTNWGPDSGVNYARVNENPSDWDTSYVQASTSGARDSYAFPGTITGISPLVAVVNCVAKNADAGSVNFQGLAYNGSSFGLGDSKVAVNSYLNTQFPIYRDPNTGAAWTKAGVNAAQFGVGVV